MSPRGRKKKTGVPIPGDPDDPGRVLAEVEDLVQRAKDAYLDLLIKAKEAENQAASYLAAAGRLRDLLGKEAPKVKAGLLPANKTPARRARRSPGRKKTGTRGRKKAPRKARATRRPRAVKAKTRDRGGNMTPEPAAPKTRGRYTRTTQPLPGTPEQRKIVMECLMDESLSPWWSVGSLAHKAGMSKNDTMILLQHLETRGLVVQDGNKALPGFRYHKRIPE